MFMPMRGGGMENNMNKKLISFFVMLSIITINFALPSFASEGAESVEQRAVKVLDFLSIIDGDDYEADKAVTRAEFIKAVVIEYGLGEAAKSLTGSGFVDVSDEYEGYVAAAKGLGFVNGYDNSTFNPDNPITVEQATKVFVSMLGYKIEAENNGGFPNGYLSAAQGIRLFDNIHSAGAGNEISMRTMVIMLYNALETEIVEPTYNTTGVAYERTGATILEECLDIYKAEGMVIANPLTGIDSANAATVENTVKIITDSQTEIYETGNSDIENMLGYNVTFYYREADGINVILGYLVSKDNRSLEIAAEDIVNVSTGSITYADSDRGTQKKAQLAPGIRIIYNGRFVSSSEYNINLLDIRLGTLRFLSTSGKSYETVFVMSYNDALFSGSSEEKLFFSESKNALSQIETDELDSIRLIKDNQTLTPDELKKGWVASVAKSLDGKVVTILFSDEAVSGKITASEKDDGKQVVKINDTRYTVSADSGKAFNTGDEGVYLLNAYSQIFTIDGDAYSKYRYAYVAYKGTDNDNESYQIKIFDQDGTMKLAAFADTVVLDNSRMNANAAYNAIPQYSLIQYQQSGEGLINKVYTPVDYTNVTSYVGYDLDNFSKDNPVHSMYFKSTLIPSFGGMYLAPSDTVVFNIPEDKTDYDNYMVTDTSIFLSDVFYNVELYDSNEQRHVSAIVNNGVDLTSSSEAVLPWNSSIFVVENTKYIYTEDRGALEVITGYQDGKEVTLIPTETNNTQFPELGNVVMEDPTDKNSTLISQLKKGNIIQYKLNAKKEVDSFRVLYDDSTNLEIRTWNGSTYAINLLTAVAMVSYIDESTICITIDDNAANSAVSNRVFALPEDLNVYIFDKETSKITMGSLYDIISMDSSFVGADKVFIRSYRDSINEIVVLRGFN